MTVREFLLGSIEYRSGLIDDEFRERASYVLTNCTYSDYNFDSPTSVVSSGFRLRRTDSYEYWQSLKYKLMYGQVIWKNKPPSILLV